MRKPRAETHQECRSLLQKAVRRGASDVAARVANHLQKVGDGKWLQTRVAVVTFEECWPLGSTLRARPDLATIVDTFTRVAESVKHKDAAGLGTLAYNLSKGNKSVLVGHPEDRAIRIVAEAIKRPKDYWPWVVEQGRNTRHAALVDSAHRAFRKGGWPWDRAFMQAAAYLAVTTTTPEPRPARAESGSFPFWVALDKHTPAGKQAISQAAKQLGIASRQALWLSFYFESALTNQLDSSYWWSREVKWRLDQTRLTPEKGEELWGKLQPVVAELLKEKAKNLGEHLNGSTCSEPPQVLHDLLWPCQLPRENQP